MRGGGAISVLGCRLEAFLKMSDRSPWHIKLELRVELISIGESWLKFRMSAPRSQFQPEKCTAVANFSWMSELLELCWKSTHNSFRYKKSTKKVNDCVSVDLTALKSFLWLTSAYTCEHFCSAHANHGPQDVLRRGEQWGLRGYYSTESR